MQRVLYFSHPASLEHDTGPHPESAERIHAIERELAGSAISSLERVEAPAATRAQLTAVHTAGHVDGVRELAEGGGGSLDPDTVASSGSYTAATHAAGGACAMADALLAGDAQAGFCAQRPPGHHAKPAHAMGFCLFNNVSVAARHALDSGQARRVFIFDWDVHHGNGTNDIFQSSSEVLYASIHQSPLYPGTGSMDEVGRGRGQGYSVNLPVPAGSDRRVWLSLVQHVVVPIANHFAPDLILVSAGFDAHRADPLASCRLESADFGQMIRQIWAVADAAGAPVGCVLEGGYAPSALAESVAETIGSLAQPQPALAGVQRCEVTQRALAVFANYWPFPAVGS